MRPPDPLKDLHHQHTIIRDRLRGVVHGHANGIYLFGRPGTSKTYMVCTALDDWVVPYKHNNGHLTPVGLFDLIAENHDRTIVLDDVTEIFSKPQALQIFLAALGTPHDGSRERLIRYKTANDNRTVRFTGGIVAISNLTLTGATNAVVSALRDRVHMIEYDPTDEQILAQINQIAASGPRGVSAKDARMVASFLASNLPEGFRLSIRLFMDKALVDYRMWAEGQSEAHWKDLIIAGVKEQTISLNHKVRDLSRAEQVEAERRIALAICHEHVDRQARVQAWRERTSKSQPAFYRRLKELKKDGRIDTGGEV
jgi:hypothetical protein